MRLWDVAKRGVGNDPCVVPPFTQSPMVNHYLVGAIHESPEHGWILHKPNGELQSAGADALIRPRKTQWKPVIRRGAQCAPVKV